MRMPDIPGNLLSGRYGGIGLAYEIRGTDLFDDIRTGILHLFSQVPGDEDRCLGYSEFNGTRIHSV